MISALILAFDDRSAPVSPEAVVRTLAIMVPVAVESLVRDVALVGIVSRPESHADLNAIADHAGCTLLFAADEGEALSSGLSALRQDAAFILRAGYAPRQGFGGELADRARDLLIGGAPGAVLRADAVGLRRALALRGPVVALLGLRKKLLEHKAAGLSVLARRAGPRGRFACGALRVG